MSGAEAVNIIAEHHAEHGEAGSQQIPGCWCGWQGEVLEHPPWHPIPGIADALHAAHVVSVLAASGHTIMPSDDVEILRHVRWIVDGSYPIDLKDEYADGFNAAMRHIYRALHPVASADEEGDTVTQSSRQECQNDNHDPGCGCGARHWMTAATPAAEEGTNG